MFTTFDKAIAALIVPVIVQWLISIGFPATTDTTTQIVSWIVTGILTLLAVYFTPNKGTAYLTPAQLAQVKDVTPDGANKPKS